MSSTVAIEMVRAEILKLRRNRTLMGFAALLSVGVVAIFFGYHEIQHLSNSQANGPAGGIDGFSTSVRLLGLFFGVLTAAVIGSEAGAADISAGVFRDLVVTGRSRRALFAVRFPAAWCLTVALTMAAFLLAVVLSFALAGGQPTPSVGVLAESVGWIVLSNAAVCALAVGIGSMTGSRAVTLTGVIGWQTVATQLIAHTSSLGSVRDALLTPALSTLMPVRGDIAEITMASLTAVIVVAVWLIVPLAGGLWRTDTADA